MNSLYIKVNVLAGAGLYDSAAEAIRLANLLNIGVAFNYNGVDLYVTKKTTVVSVVKEYDKRLEDQAKQW